LSFSLDVSVYGSHFQKIALGLLPQPWNIAPYASLMRGTTPDPPHHLTQRNPPIERAENFPQHQRGERVTLEIVAVNPDTTPAKPKVRPLTKRASSESLLRNFSALTNFYHDWLSGRIDLETPRGRGGTPLTDLAHKAVPQKQGSATSG
jgi:hypothetical protein